MESANIAVAKNQFSRLIDRVKRGESILITERNQPVARIEPLVSQSKTLQALHSCGLLAPPTARLDLAGLLAMPAPKLSAAQSLSQAVIDEREESR